MRDAGTVWGASSDARGRSTRRGSSVLRLMRVRPVRRFSTPRAIGKKIFEGPHFQPPTPRMLESPNRLNDDIGWLHEPEISTFVKMSVAPLGFPGLFRPSVQTG